MRTTISNDTFIRALLRQPTDYTPIWLMRQAGRYLPEYCETRAKAGSFMKLCQTPDLACEVTLQPLLRYKLDAAILFSDILTIPHAMDIGLHFAEGEGPIINHPIRDAKAVQALPIPDPEEELRYVMDAVRTIKRTIAGQVPLIGFAGSPWTLATYMVEGSSSKTFGHIKHMLYKAPELLHALLRKLTEATILYLNAQISAGADVIMLFDTWGGVLSPHDYQHFSLQYMKQIFQSLPAKHEGQLIPRIMFTKGGSNWLEDMATLNVHGLGLDWSIDIGKARQRVGDKVALQGNLDPYALMASPERIEKDVANILASFGQGSGHIFNLGHGIDKHTPPEQVGFLVETVHRLSKPYHIPTTESHTASKL